MAPSTAKRQKKDFSGLQSEVIGAGLCTACGTCIGVCPTGGLTYDMQHEEPALAGKCTGCGLCSAACPGRDVPLPRLENMVFGREMRPEEFETGIYRRYIKAYAVDPGIKQAGASGGTVSALLIYALDKGIIRGATLAGMSKEQPWRAQAKLATNRQEVLEGGKSKYTVVPNNLMLGEASRRGLDALAVVGCPCHIHGARKIQMHGKPPRLAKAIKFSVGLFCAANFSHEVTEYAIARYTGVPLDEVARFDYRGGPQSQDVVVTTKSGETRIVPQAGYARVISRTRRDRCAMCTDFSAEFADISVGDIFTQGPAVSKVPGFSAVLTRTDVGETLINDAARHGYVHLAPLDTGGFTNNGGYEVKKYYAKFYLVDRARHGWPVPDYGREAKVTLPRLDRPTLP